MESVIAVFIPIIFFLVVGLVLVISIFYKSKEKQMLTLYLKKDKGIEKEVMESFQFVPLVKKALTAVVR